MSTLTRALGRRGSKRSHRGRKQPGGGYDNFIEPAPEWRASTFQACGLYPFAVGGPSPVAGVPLGFNMLTGETVCCDVISWYADEKILAQPSSATLGLPALGKSTGERKELLGLAARGVTSICAGDLKPDYADIVRAIGGQVIEMGRGRGSLNPLDPGTLAEAAARLTGTAANKLREEAHGRRLNMVLALLAMMRGQSASDTERTVLSAALRVLADKHSGAAAPVLGDLLTVLNHPPDSVRQPTLDRGEDDVYRMVVDPLQRSLLALIDGELGDTFAKPTSTRLRLDATAICVDVSGLGGHDEMLTASVLLATWNECYGAVWASNALADAGVAPQRHFKIILDELWRVLQAGPGMVDRINFMGRTNRQDGIGQAIITHTLADFNALANEADRKKAYGFIERSNLLKLYGLPRHELDEIDANIVRLTTAEKDLVSSWHTPTSLSSSAAPPGRGKVLLKVANRPGIPVQIVMTEAEKRADVHNTDKRWTS
jgi:hypothetical protein